MRELHAHLAYDGVVDLRRFRRPAAREQPQGGDHRFARLLALLGEEHGVEGRGPAGHRDAVLAVALQRVRQRELLEHHRREPVQQEHHRVVGAGDMGVREGHRAHVRLGEPQRVGEARAARDERTVRVEHTLGVGGRAGGPVDPADRGALGGRGR